MADPVSLLGTVPALVALPAVCLQAIQTIQGFYSSLKHALSDVAQLLEELEAMRALTLRCLALPAADVPGDELQLWTKACSSLKIRIGSLTARLTKLKTKLDAPSVGGVNVRGRIQKYLSEPYVEGERKYLSEQKATLTVLFNSLQYKKLGQLCADMGVMQQLQESIRTGQEQMLDMFRQQQALMISSQGSPASTASLITSATNQSTEIRRRKRNNISKCALGLCGCQCHRMKFNIRSWLISGPTECFMACGCEDRFYQWTVFAFGRLVAMQAGFRKAGEACISWSITPRATVRYTSPGFRVLEKCIGREITAARASQEMVMLRDTGIISTKDVNPDGEGYFDYLIRYSWGVGERRISQFQLLGLLAKEGFLSDGDKLLRRCLSWVGEGPHMLLLTQLLGLTESLTEVGPEVFSAWPTPLNSNFAVIYTYPDCFFIEALSFLASADPEFGGTTRLQAAILTYDVELTKRLLDLLPEAALLARNFFGQSALHLAIRNPDTVDLLLQTRFAGHVDEQDNHGVTALMYSAAYGEIDSTKTLLLAGADPYRQDRLNHMDFWTYALFCNKLEYVQEVFEFYTENFENDFARAMVSCLCIRLIQHAAHEQDIYNGTLEFLLRLEPLPEEFTVFSTPLLHLCRNNEEALLMMQYYQGSMNAANERGYYPMMVFAYYREPAKVFQIAIANGSNPNHTDKHGMNAFHHLNASMARFGYGTRDVEKCVIWMNAAAVLLSNGIDINHGDMCECPCSRAGCSLAQACFWQVRSICSSQQGGLLSIPWLVELFLILERTQSKNSIKAAIGNLHRFQLFEEWSLKHTCHDHGNWTWIGSRPKIRFHAPQDDIIFGIKQERQCTGWDEEAKEIAEEQQELVRQLEDECTRHCSELSDDLQKEWTKLLARQAVLLEFKLNIGWKEKMKQRKMWPEQKKPRAEDVITTNPLGWVDNKRDCFATSPLVVSTYDFLSEENCRIEYYLDRFLDHFDSGSTQCEYMNGEAIENWSAQRDHLLKDLMEEVRRLRKVPVEERNWDID